MNKAQHIAEKLNKRTSYEWDAFMKKHGNSWDEFSAGAKQLACELAEKQSKRDMQELYSKFEFI